MADRKMDIDGRPARVVALIVGAGAVNNAWEPVRRALRPFVGDDLTSDMANAHLTRLVYLMRWFNSGRVTGEHSANAKDHCANLYSQVCAEIRSELIASEKSKELTTRPELSAVMDRFVLPGLRDLMVVNTNWDTIADKAVERHLLRTHDGVLSALHVHGCASLDEPLFLPSEITQEPYRSAAEDMAIGTMHGSIMSGVEKADRVVIYGLSLDPLDAELSQILESGWRNPNLRIIHIVNPDHELVAGRVRLLVHDDRVDIVGHDPSALP
jgi:hypothetical protein